MFSISVIKNEIPKVMAKATFAATIAPRSEISAIAQAYKAKAQQGAKPHPGRDTGRVASQIHYEIRPHGNEFNVKISARNQAVFANDGRGPGGAPFGPITDWAVRHGIPVAAAGAIALSIANKGTKGLRFMEEAVPVANAMLPTAMAKILAALK